MHPSKGKEGQEKEGKKGLKMSQKKYSAVKKKQFKQSVDMGSKC